MDLAISSTIDWFSLRGAQLEWLLQVLLEGIGYDLRRDLTR
jgi:hypothetical protein